MESISGFTALITGLFVIIAVKPEAGPYNGPISGAAFGSQKHAQTWKRYRPMLDRSLPHGTVQAFLRTALGS